MIIQGTFDHNIDRLFGLYRTPFDQTSIKDLIDEHRRVTWTTGIIVKRNYWRGQKGYLGVIGLWGFIQGV